MVAPKDVWDTHVHSTGEITADVDAHVWKLYSSFTAAKTTRELSSYPIMYIPFKCES